jgi:hypothetical protein
MECLFIFTMLWNGFFTHYANWWIGLSGMVLWPLWLLNLAAAYILVDLHEQLEKHRCAGWTAGLHGLLFKNFTQPSLWHSAWPLSLFWNIIPALTGAWYSFIVLKVKLDLFTVCPDSCHVCFNVPIILELFNHLLTDDILAFGKWYKVIRLLALQAIILG